MTKQKPNLSERAQKAAEARQQALAQALRANIAKRRQQTRGRADGAETAADGSISCGSEATCAKKGD